MDDISGSGSASRVVRGNKPRKRAHRQNAKCDEGLWVDSKCGLIEHCEVETMDGRGHVGRYTGRSSCPGKRRGRIPSRNRDVV